MSQLSQIVPLLRDCATHRQEIVQRMRRLNENFACSSTEAMGLWSAARRADLGPLDLETCSVALLGDTTQDFFAPHLYSAAFACGLQLKIFCPGAGRLADLVFEPGSALYAVAPKIVFLHYNQEEKLGRVLYATLEREQRLTAVREWLDEIRLTVGRLAENLPSAKIVLYTVHWFHPPVLGFIDAVRADGPSDITAFLNEELRAIARSTPNVHLLDMQRVVGTVGFAQWRDNNRWFGESVETVAGNNALARECMRFVKAFTKRSRKVIVVDLDNTLWGGLAGEEGLTGIRLGGGYPGNAYRQFQQVLKLYSERGVLLAINSKNNRDDAIAILDQHPEMVLRPSDFVAMEINWRDKVSNLAEIARQLELGLNSFVFVDDNPAERELVRNALPDVLVPEFPTHVADLPYLLGRLNDFDYESYTETDRERTRMYKTDSLRRDLRNSVASLDEYLAMLGTVVTVARAKEADLGRVEQMFQRTNQFNTTTKRYTLGELSAFARRPDCSLMVASANDRFGDHGIVAAALLKLNEFAVIDSFLMSCRVIGRGLESAVLAELARLAVARGYAELRGEFVATKKNEPSRGVYVQHGFASEGVRGAVEMFVRRDLSAAPIRVPAYLSLQERIDD